GLTGANAGLAVGRLLTVSPGAYALAGADTALMAVRVIGVDAGAYVAAGPVGELCYETLHKEQHLQQWQHRLARAPVEQIYSGAASGSQSGFVLVDVESSMWWKRKPKAVPKVVAEKRLARVVKALDAVATEQIKADEPIKRSEVREQIAPLLAE